VIGKSYVVRWSNLYFKFTIGAVCSSHRSCCTLRNAPTLLILFRRSGWFSWTRIICNEPTPKWLSTGKIESNSIPYQSQRFQI
jgi:hypothetical protein